MSNNFSSWENYDPDKHKGPLSLAWRWIVGSAIIVLMLWGVFSVIGFFTSNANEAATVAQEQFGARASLRKYEWFKDAYAQLEKKRADIALYDARAASCRKDGTTFRDEREACRQAESERLGVIASYNTLAAEYNANSSKFNWSPYGQRNASVPETIQPYNVGAP